MKIHTDSIVTNSTTTSGVSINMTGGVGTWTFARDGGLLSNMTLGNDYYTGYYTINPINGLGWQFIAPSDKSMKNNINLMDSQLDNLLKLKPVTFNYNSELNDPKLHYGFIAQDVEPLFPYCVSFNSRNDKTEPTKNLNMQNFIPFIIKSIQEQNEIICKQKNDILEITELVKDQSQQINLLKQDNNRLNELITKLSSKNKL